MKCIYVRTNLVNGKQYVGQANDFDKREKDWAYLKWRYGGTYINNARKKYGIENFKVEILRECEAQNELNEWEKYYIKELNTKSPYGYNLTDGGDGVSGYKFSEESKEKMSKAKKGKYLGENSWNYGITRSEETRQKISDSLKCRTAWNKGIPMREESKRKLSEARKGKPSNKKSKTIYQYTLDGELVKVWTSIKELRKEYSCGCVWECCNEIRKTHKGYRWSYKLLS